MLKTIVTAPALSILSKLSLSPGPSLLQSHSFFRDFCCSPPLSLTFLLSMAALYVVLLSSNPLFHAWQLENPWQKQWQKATAYTDFAAFQIAKQLQISCACVLQ